MARDLQDLLRRYKERYDKLNELMEYPEINVDYNFSRQFIKEIDKLKPIADEYEKYVLSNFKDEKIRAKIQKILSKEYVDTFDGLEIVVNSKKNAKSEYLIERYKEYFKGASYEIIDRSNGIAVLGASTYTAFKYETGIHKIDGDEISVLVIPYVEDNEIIIKESDLSIDAFHSSGAGGQNINKVETAIRIKHIPTNIVVTCQDERSQLQNKNKALDLMTKKVNEYYQNKLKKELQQISNKALKDLALIRTYDTKNGELFDIRTQKKYNINSVFKYLLSEINSEILVNDIK